MESKLILPDGVRLASREEIPGPSAELELIWARVQLASISAGYTLQFQQEDRFRFYAEINVDAPEIWNLFLSLCNGLLGEQASLLFGENDDEVQDFGLRRKADVLELLAPVKYQLSHDGSLQFGLIEETETTLNEVLVAQTKHFKVWFDDETTFRAILKEYSIPEAESLDFLDEYPRIITSLPQERLLFEDNDQLIRYLEKGA